MQDDEELKTDEAEKKTNEENEDHGFNKKKKKNEDHGGQWKLMSMHGELRMKLPPMYHLILYTYILLGSMWLSETIHAGIGKSTTNY